ncbi:MAG: thiopurine S-methyltransferase [Pseudomonadota bacterium]
MDALFWHKRWQDNQIGFHESSVNPLLVEHFRKMGLGNHSRILVPLCGKSHDLTWLVSQGLTVVGVELSKVAVESYFSEYGLDAVISSSGTLLSYKVAGLEILVGDIFQVTKAMLGTIDGIYDRAALVALPDAMRRNYTQQLMDITASARQLLISYEYDQSLMEGPPFSISDDEIKRHYGNSYEILLQQNQRPVGKFTGQAVNEKVWLLKTK